MRTGRARLLAVAVAAAVMASTAGSAAIAGGGSRDGAMTVRERLTGYEETPLALSTTGNGQFRARIDERAQEITYTLEYGGLEAPITQAHIHFGLVAQTGGISVFLCTNMGNGPAGTQTCPDAPATISGTIRPTDVIGPTGQGIGAGEFAELIAAYRAGRTYVNVHSTLYPIGEIRAQLGHH